MNKNASMYKLCDNCSMFLLEDLELTLSPPAIHTQDEAVLAGQSAILTCQIQGYTTVINDDQVKWSSINGMSKS